MALGIYEEEDIRAIAKVIRNNLGNDTKYTTEQMPDAINVIQTYAYNNGHSEGKDEGLEEGKAIGYEEGKTDGLAEGIEQGKTEAYSEIEPINAQLENTIYGEDIDVAGTVVDALGKNVNQANSDFVAIKGKIVEKGVEVADGTRTAEYADKVDAVFEAGQEEAHFRFWDSFQAKGTRTSWSRAFEKWDTLAIYPVHDIKPEGDVGYLFYKITGESIDISERFSECGIVFDTSKATSISYAFYSSLITRIPKIDTTAMDKVKDFAPSTVNLHTIDEIILRDDGSQTFGDSMVSWDSSLTNVKISGTIGNDIKFTGCSALSHESLMSIINALKDFRGTDTWKTISIGLPNLAKLSAEEIEIMDTKQWNYN